MSHVEASVEAKAAPTPAANAAGAPAGSPRRARRTPFSAVAPTMTGSATWRDSSLASRRGRSRAGAPRRASPVARDARARARTPARCRARARRAARRRRAGGRRARRGRRPGHRAPSPRSSPTAIVGGRAEPPLDRALERVADDRRRQERADARASRRRRSKPRAASRDLVAQRDEQRRGRPGVQRDLEGLAQLAVQLGVRPAQQPRDERDVRRGRDRQQLGGTVQGSPSASAWRSGSAALRRSHRAARARAASARRGRRSPTTISATTA